MMIWPRRHLLASVAIQGLGAAATFAVGLGIAAWQGPQAQGRYGLVRSAADLLLALALFGLPQSMLHALNQRGASAARLEGMSWRYAAALLAAALFTALLLALSGASGGWLADLGNPWLLAALWLGSVGWVLQGLLRVFALGRGSATQFAWASVTPSLSLLAAVGVLLAWGSQRYELALAASGIASVWLAARQLRPLRLQPDWRQGGAAPLASLLRDGTHAFAQAVTLALQPWLTLLLLRWQGATVGELGHFVFAAYVFHAFALPTSFVAPLLFARISAAAGAGREFGAAAIVRRVLGWTSVAALIVAALLPWAVTGLFAADYAPAIPACVLLALGGPWLVANRLGVAVLFGLGRFRFASAHALLRALLLPLCLWAIWRSGAWSRVTAAGLAWLMVEALCALALLVAWKRLPLAPADKGVA